MSDDFQVGGVDDFLRLSKALKRAGHGEMRKRLHTSLKKAVAPVMPKAEERLRKALPSGIPRTKRVNQTTLVKTGRDPGITVAVRYGSKRASNAVLVNKEGRFRHPIFGSKGWTDQQAPGGQGWFDETYRGAGPDILDEIEKTLQDIADEIVRAVK